MAIVAGDILFKLTTTTGPGNTNAGAPVSSFGEFMAVTQISGTALNNLFDDVSGDENAASDVEYRCLFVHNNHASLTYQSVVCWGTGEVAGGANITLGVDTNAAVDSTSAVAQALEIIDEGDSTAVLAGVTFVSTATSKATGRSIGNLAAGSCRAIWLCRTAANSAALNNDGIYLNVEGDTGA